MKGWTKRLDLFEQGIGQPLSRHDRQRGNVVDGLFRVEFGALAARLGQDIQNMRLDVQKSEFEDSEQADRPSTDDDAIGLDRRG